MFYLVIIQNSQTPAIFSYHAYEDALAAYHTELSYRAEGRVKTVCGIFTEELMLMKSEIYTAPVSDNTEEPTEG